MTPNEVAAYIADNGGGTFAYDNVSDALAVREYKDGYAVGIADGTAVLLDRDATPDQVYSALKHVVSEWLTVHVGAWVTDDGNIAIDPIRVLTGLPTAMRLAREHNQQAIFGFAEDQAIQVSTGGVL